MQYFNELVERYCAKNDINIEDVIRNKSDSQAVADDKNSSVINTAQDQPIHESSTITEEQTSLSTKEQTEYYTLGILPKDIHIEYQAKKIHYYQKKIQEFGEEESVKEVIHEERNFSWLWAIAG